MSDDVELLKRVYDLFNSRDIESVLAAMHPDGHLGKWNGRWPRPRTRRGARLLETSMGDPQSECRARRDLVQLRGGSRCQSSSGGARDTSRTRGGVRLIRL